MVYVEKKKINNSNYYYLTCSIRKGIKIKKLRKYIGKELKFSIKFFEDTIDGFVKEEYNLLSNKNIDGLTLSTKAIKEIIIENLKISHLCEFDKELKKKLDIYFPIIFIFNSNSIEGSTMPLEEVENYIIKKKSKHQDKNEIQEVENSIKCFNYLKTDFKYTMKSILELHSKLINNLFYDKEKTKPYIKGFKTRPIVVGNNFDGYSETTKPEEVRKKLSELIKWYIEKKKIMHPLKLAFNFYAKFERIHPFEDGNGRIGRLIMNKILMDNKYLPFIIYSANKRSHGKAFDKLIQGKNIYFNDFLIKQYRKSLRNYYSLAINLHKKNKLFKSKYFQDK